jgi:serine protease Do
MYHPFEDDNNGNTNQNNDKNTYYDQSMNHSNHANDDQNSSNHTEWQGDYYHSYQEKSTPTYSWEQPPVQEPPKAFFEPKTPKKHHGGKKTFLKVTSAVMACVVISASSIMGFTALVNNGYVKLSSASTASSSDAAFTITKLVNNTTSASTTASKLTLQEIAKKVVPSVVCIENYQVAQSTRYTMGGSAYGNGNQANGADNTATAGSTTGDSSVDPTSEGSGIIATSDGYIITNAHVVSGATSLKVITSDGKSYVAKLIGSDSVTDLAVVKIEATGLSAAEFGSSDDLKVADTVMAVGNPGGYEFNSSVTIGYVSALNRDITNSETGYTMKCIQTDAAINPGNSGGALVNSYGQVVGINSSKIVATGYEGLGFSIPINVAQPVISDLKQYGYVKDRAVLGISGQYIDSMTARFYSLSTGMYVSAVTGSAVSAAGIKKGDVITKIDGKDVTSETVITSAVTAKKPGDTVTLTVTSATTGDSFTAKVKLSQATGK